MKEQGRDFAAAWGRWSGKRELVRGLLHSSIGFIGWALLQPVGIDSDLLTFLLFVVATTFIILEGARLAVNRWRNKDWYARFLQWVNNRVVKKFLTRETENHQQTTIVPSVLGLSVAWAIGDVWVCTVAVLFFGLVDPLAKLGKYWPIKVFNKGRAKDKSWGGLLFGLLGGAIAITLVLSANFWAPILPPGLSIWTALVIYLAGLLTASLLELFGGKLDNFLIPAGSVAVMTALSKLFFS